MGGFCLLACADWTQIAEKTKLIVVPDGPLWDVPFEALQPTEDKYVIDRASVSYAPSLSALREMRRRRPTRAPNRGQPSTLIVFSNPTLSKEIVERVQTTYSGLQIPETVTETSEIEKFQSIYGLARVRSYTDVGAKKERLKADLSVAGALYFASPAILDNAVPMYSFVVVSPDPDLRDDGLLRLSEITNLNSRARIVILPHVFSAKDNSQSGNALIALSWSWFVAGTPAVLLNRWSGQMFIGN